MLVSSETLRLNERGRKVGGLSLMSWRRMATLRTAKCCVGRTSTSMLNSQEEERIGKFEEHNSSLSNTSLLYRMPLLLSSLKNRFMLLEEALSWKERLDGGECLDELEASVKYLLFKLATTESTGISSFTENRSLYPLAWIKVKRLVKRIILGVVIFLKMNFELI